VKSTDGFIFGGYAGLAWDSSNQYKLDPNAFIFTFNNPYKPSDLELQFNSITDAKGIYCNSNYGPAFYRNSSTLSTPDLRISFNEKESEFFLKCFYHPSQVKNKNYYFVSYEEFDWIELEVYCIDLN
jgi:hypothetical protein